MPDLRLLIVQIGVVLLAARLVGAAFRRLHQPQVVGEMLAGLLLGPSVLGWLAPPVFGTLFPADSLGFLTTLSQLGLLMFMFLVGLELDPALLRGVGRSAVTISWASIVVPLGLGIALASALYPSLAPPDVPFASFALFMGTAMSVTAFPVLARILAERELLSTRIGALAIACAAVDDVSAWTMLAAVVLLARASSTALPLPVSVLGSAAFVGLMLVVVRPRLRRFEVVHARQGRLTRDLLTLVLLLTLVSGFVTEALGIHALFGAFLAGVCLPKSPGFVHDLAEKLEDVTVVLLLPLYFAITGLRTSVGLLNSLEAWGVCGLVVLVAIAGKWGGAMAAGRAAGLSWREAGAIGVLMNTRGLVELVILNVGLDVGVLSPTLFAMLVLMALATTLMTTPLLDVVCPSRYLRPAEPAPVPGAVAARL